jgi:hypothetical protein
VVIQSNTPVKHYFFRKEMPAFPIEERMLILNLLMFRHRTLLLGLLMYVVPVFVPAADAKDTLVSVLADTAGYSLRIESVTVPDMQLHDTLDVILTTDGSELAGFDFLIMVEEGYASIDTILPGQLLDSCRWQYFTSHKVNSPDTEKNRQCLWQTIALAESVGGSAKPICFGMKEPVSLLKIVVSGPANASIPDTLIPVSFFWQNCGSNTLAGRSGHELSMSRQVYDPMGNAQLVVDTFPNLLGTPELCIKKNSPNPPKRLIDYYQGYIQYKLHLGQLKIDSLPIKDDSASQ